MKKGLVVGKFYPPHKGHSYLINKALENCDQLTVLVCDSKKYSIDAKTRAKWIKSIHKDAKVKIIPDIGKDDDSKAWGKHTIDFLGYAPDIVFSSEDYGVTYAKAMKSEHYMVDRMRSKVPISATKVRNNVIENWNFLKPIVRQKYCIRICIIGAESTGTTTLTKDLAYKYQAPWVPEYGRIYTESLITAGPSIEWNHSDFSFIADQQNKFENKIAGKSNGLIFCDTNAYATKIWHKRYMGSDNDINQEHFEAKADLYIVTSPDIPFAQDSIRDGEFLRKDMHKWFIDDLKNNKLPYIVVKGDKTSRINQASKIIDKVISKKVIIR